MIFYDKKSYNLHFSLHWFFSKGSSFAASQMTILTNQLGKDFSILLWQVLPALKCCSFDLTHKICSQKTNTKLSIGALSCLVSDSMIKMKWKDADFDSGCLETSCFNFTSCLLWRHSTYDISVTRCFLAGIWSPISSQTDTNHWKKMPQYFRWKSPFWWWIYKSSNTAKFWTETQKLHLYFKLTKLHLQKFRNWWVLKLRKQF